MAVPAAKFFTSSTIAFPAGDSIADESADIESKATIEIMCRDEGFDDSWVTPPLLISCDVIPGSRFTNGSCVATYTCQMHRDLSSLPTALA